MIANVSGAFALGVLVAAVARPDGALRAAVGTGLLGAFTTFSTFTVDAVLLVGVTTDPSVVAIVGVGVLGGLTTFSTWMVEATDPAAGPVQRALEVMGRLALGLAVAAGGLAVAGALNP